MGPTFRVAGRLVPYLIRSRQLSLIRHFFDSSVVASYGGSKKMFVQKLARDGHEPSHPYIRREDERPTDASHPSSPIPAVDLELLFSSNGDSQASEMEKLRSALHSWGFFQAIGHGIPSSLIDDVGKITREFFHLSTEERKRYSKAVYGDGNSIDEIASEGKIIDWCDHLYFLVLPEDERELSCWPENPSSLREIMNEYTKKIKAVIEVILKAIAKLLDLEEDYFIKQFGDKATTFARFNYYPRCSRPDLVLGIKSHSDGSGITILLPDQMVDGLEVLKDGQWVKVHAIPYALVVNIGDQMEIMSNGIFKSPVHRAVTNSEKERISLAMFLAAEAEKELGPAEQLIDEDNGRPRLYKKLKVKEYLEVFSRNFTQGKRSIDWAKV
ncbi:jasmonate-induced oxygenase 4-like [Magnolia sinica]|uniref:jasmonate-induced oxygenase 4-like n=1 Tax=Magnolia sinica TaxID=86752 RepID=UPI0026599775|nr:jasmonate-induced oxygenase 4-like [Magnolia sinica]